MNTKLAILGSTGSVGTQALDVVAKNRDNFNISILAANKNWQLIVKQAKEFHPKLVFLADSDAAMQARRELGSKFEVINSKNELISSLTGVDAVLGAMVGFEGLEPVLAALELGKTVALANKETLVAGGALVRKAMTKGNAKIIPVDSEHTSVFCCLKNNALAVRKIYLTASGGPFFNDQAINLDTVTPEQALKHPKWSMGAKISIDSATMMNKGLEVIEAAVLFNLSAEQIGVVVHPEHIIHAIVEYEDANSLAVMYEPDMRVCIATAFKEIAGTSCLKTGAAYLDFTKANSLNFFPPDFKRFPALSICYQALKAGAGATAVVNAANEVAVSLFLKKLIKFTDIAYLVEKTLTGYSGQEPESIDNLIELDTWARQTASNITRL